MRNLAQRSAAAKEIKVLIGDSVEKVEADIGQINQAKAEMDSVIQQNAALAKLRLPPNRCGTKRAIWRN